MWAAPVTPPTMNGTGTCRSAVRCAAGTLFDQVTGTCQGEVSCPAGTQKHLVSGECIGPISCPDGTTRAAGATCDGPLYCDEGFTLSGNRCVGKPECDAGSAMVRGVCQAPREKVTSQTMMDDDLRAIGAPHHRIDCGRRAITQFELVKDGVMLRFNYRCTAEEWVEAGEEPLPGGSPWVSVLSTPDTAQAELRLGIFGAIKDALTGGGGSKKEAFEKTADWDSMIAAFKLKHKAAAVHQGLVAAGTGTPRERVDVQRQAQAASQEGDVLLRIVLDSAGRDRSKVYPVRERVLAPIRTHFAKPAVQADLAEAYLADRLADIPRIGPGKVKVGGVKISKPRHFGGGTAADPNLVAFYTPIKTTIMTAPSLTYEVVVAAIRGGVYPSVLKSMQANHPAMVTKVSSLILKRDSAAAGELIAAAIALDDAAALKRITSVPTILRRLAEAMYFQDPHTVPLSSGTPVAADPTALTAIKVECLDRPVLQFELKFAGNDMQYSYACGATKLSEVGKKVSETKNITRGVETTAQDGGTTESLVSVESKQKVVCDGGEVLVSFVVREVDLAGKKFLKYQWKCSAPAD